MNFTIAEQTLRASTALPIHRFTDYLPAVPTAGGRKNLDWNGEGKNSILRTFYDTKKRQIHGGARGVWGNGREHFIYHCGRS